MAAPEMIGTHLWFEERAVEAAEFYVSLFPDSWIVDVSTEVVPAHLVDLMSPNPKRVMEALLKMGRIDIAGLREAGSDG